MLLLVVNNEIWSPVCFMSMFELVAVKISDFFLIKLVEPWAKVIQLCTATIDIERLQYPNVDYGEQDKWIIQYNIEQIDQIIGVRVQFPTSVLDNVSVACFCG